MRAITMTDLCELTAYSRHQMRGLLDELPQFAEAHTRRRVARAFSNYDLMLIAVLCRLETNYGLKRSAVAALSEAIAVTLKAPRRVSNQACLILRIQDATCKYVDSTPSIEDGMVVALAPIFLAIDSYLLPAPLVQREVGLSATSKTSPSSASSSVTRPARAARDVAPQQRQRGRANHG